MSLGQLNGLDVNALMGQQAGPSASMVGNEFAESAGDNFLAQVFAGQSSSAGVNTPSVVKAAFTAADRLPELSNRNREVSAVNEHNMFARVTERAEGEGNDNAQGEEVAVGAEGEASAEGELGAEAQVIPADSNVTQADLQNMEYDYDGDGAVTVDEAEVGKAIDAGIIDVAIMIGANSVMSMFSQMERDRAQSERIARS